MVKGKKWLAGMVNRRPLSLAFWLAGLVANPFESPCGDQADNQKVVTAKAGGVFPGVSVPVGPLEGHIEHGTLVGVLCPDAGADGAVTDFLDGLFIGITDRCLIFHDLFFCLFNVRREVWRRLLARALASGNLEVFKVRLVRACAVVRRSR